MKYCRSLICCGNKVNKKELDGAIQEHVRIKLWLMSEEHEVRKIPTVVTTYR